MTATIMMTAVVVVRIMSMPPPVGGVAVGGGVGDAVAGADCDSPGTWVVGVVVGGAEVVGGTEADGDSVGTADPDGTAAADPIPTTVSADEP